jgi:nucleoside-diphosphate-sugar epimerase
MHVLVTGGTGHIGAYIIPELIAAGHEVTGLARSDTSAAAVSALGAKVLRGDISDLDGLKAAAADADGVIAHRQDLLASGGLNAVAAAERQIMLAYGEAMAGSGKPLVVSASIGSPGWEGLGRPANEEDPALPGGDAYKGTLRVRNIVETTVLGLADLGVRSSVVRIPPIAHSMTDVGRRRASSVTLETARTFGRPFMPAISPPCSA